jgi:hypothetical protein
MHATFDLSRPVMEAVGTGLSRPARVRPRGTSQAAEGIRDAPRLAVRPWLVIPEQSCVSALQCFVRERGFAL